VHERQLGGHKCRNLQHRAACCRQGGIVTPSHQVREGQSCQRVAYVRVDRVEQLRALEMPDGKVCITDVGVRSRMIGFCIIGDRCSWGERS
jgi:hypothetical protein